MKKLSYSEILEIIKEKCETVSNFAYGSLGEYAKNNGKVDYNKWNVEGLGLVTRVEEHGGEDQGTEWYVVYKFEDHDVYIKVSGYYTSYNGTDFDGGWACCSDVKPTEKTITVYV